jgi:hypothetical protein
MSSPSIKTIKALFGRSNNNCAFPKCTIKMIDEESDTIIGEICHIEAKNPKGPRYNPSQTDEERDSFDNLILMCSIHHKVIDDDSDSYSVERLRQIKNSDEAKFNNTTENDEKRRHFDEVLDRLITLIAEKEPANDETRKEIHALENSALARAKKLAKEKQIEISRKNWFVSPNALTDVVNSVNEIFHLIDNHVSDEIETFEMLEIKLHQEKFLRSIHNRKFGCQIELKGFDETYTTYLSTEIYFQLVVYSKTPLPQNRDLFHTKAISNPFVLKPTVSEQLEVVWKLATGEQYSPVQLCEWFIKLFIDRIEKPRAIDESISGGRYIVDGRVVNANGEEIE